MKVVHGLEGVEHDRSSVVTVGTFDGVHLAHREIINEVVDRGRRSQGRSVVISFNPHPREIVGGGKDPVRLLTTLHERVSLLETLHVDLLVLVPFTREFSLLSPRDFFIRYVVQGIGVSEVVVGYDHTFGRDRGAGIEELVHLGQEFDFSVFALHPYTVNGETVSSTAIRQALSAGDVERARHFLGYEYSLSGLVVQGDGRGKTIGYPTANMLPGDPAKLVPGRGVYLVGVREGGTQRFGMMNIGVRPTVSAGTTLTLEVHIFDFDGDLYGREVTIAFLRRLREERRFGSVEELTRQLEQDRAVSMRMLAGERYR